MERFLIAAHSETGEIARARHIQGTNITDLGEITRDALTYFETNQDAFRSEFSREAIAKIGSAEFDLFCAVIANEWYDGKKQRVNGRPRQLKRSIYEYIMQVSSLNVANDCTASNDLPTDVSPLISTASIASILTINNQMLVRHIDQWKKLHPNHDTISNDDIFIRRGLYLEAKFQDDIPYREWGFINSYSLAFTAPEKFAQSKPGKIPAIVNGNIAVFHNRVLFFSPFVPGMEVCQYELGIIPSERALKIFFQGEHAGIHEYRIEHGWPPSRGRIAATEEINFPPSMHPVNPSVR